MGKVDWTLVMTLTIEATASAGHGRNFVVVVHPPSVQNVATAEEAIAFATLALFGLRCV